jgi:transcriptional regulator with XRE-family HTH domain
MISNLAKIREDKGLTQLQMAKKLNIAVSTYCQYENGIRNIPSSIAKSISKILEQDTNNIFLPTKFTIREI